MGALSQEIQGTFFALTTAVLRAFGILCCVYLQMYKGASAAQVLFVVEFGVFIQMVLYIAANETARQHFKDFMGVNRTSGRNKKFYKILLYRSVGGGFSTLLLYISGYYLHTGDIGALYNISIILFSFVATLYSFANALSKATIVGIPIAIIGIICICQPPFLFKSDVADGLAVVGVLSVCLGGALRSYCNLIVHQNTSIHWSLIVVITSFVCSIVAIVSMIGEYLYNTRYLHNADYAVWATFGGSVVTNVILSSMAIRSSVLMVLITLTFQLGSNYLKLEIVLSTAEVLCCYLLEYLLLSTVSNKITYFGVICVIVSSIVINYQIHQTKNERSDRNEYAIVNQESSAAEFEFEYPQIAIEFGGAEDSIVNLILRHWMIKANVKMDDDDDVQLPSSVSQLIIKYQAKCNQEEQ